MFTLPGWLRLRRRVSLSTMVVVTSTSFSVALRVGVAPPPDGLEMDTVKVSLFSARMSSVVLTVNVLSAWSADVNVNVPDAAV